VNPHRFAIFTKIAMRIGFGLLASHCSIVKHLHQLLSDQIMRLL